MHLRQLLFPLVDWEGVVAAQRVRCGALDAWFTHFPLLGNESQFVLVLPFLGMKLCCSCSSFFPFRSPHPPPPPLFVHGSVVLRRWRQRGVPSFRAALLRDLCVEQWCQGASKASASAAASACGELGHQDHRGAVWFSINTLSSRDLTGLGRCAVRCEQRRYRLAFRSRAGCAARALLYFFRSMV